MCFGTNNNAGSHFSPECECEPPSGADTEPALQQMPDTGTGNLGTMIGSSALQRAVLAVASNLQIEAVLDSAVLPMVLTKAIERTGRHDNHAFTGKSADLLIGKREALKVIAGSVRKDRIAGALARTSTDERRLLSERYCKALEAPDENDRTSDPGAWLDPECWVFAPVPSTHEIDLRLSFLVSGMLAQEEGLAEQRVSLRAAARWVANERRRWRATLDRPVAR